MYRVQGTIAQDKQLVLKTSLSIVLQSILMLYTLLLLIYCVLIYIYGLGT